jgi:hypothetical protein
MASGFEERHAASIHGSLTTVDRLIIHGHLRLFFEPSGFVGFMLRQGVKASGFGQYVEKATEQLCGHVRRLATDSGRDVIWQPGVVQGKDRLAREIASRDGITEGLICVFSTLELANCFAFSHGTIVRQQRKCLHFYLYLIDPELGFMHLRIQSWFPFLIQIYINGREWLSRQLDRRQVGYRRYENTFLQIDDLPLAQRLCAGFSRRRWWRVFDAFARRINPLLPAIKRHGFGSYYWVIDACEVATDVMWLNRRTLLTILDDLIDHAIRAFSAKDVVRFLGHKVYPRSKPLLSDYKWYPPGDATAAQFHPEARRIKHRLWKNWIKMYDKWSVLRVETVINYPKYFKVLKFEKDRKGRKRGHWTPMNKNVQNLWRYLELGEASNRRYLDALVTVRPTKRAIAELDVLCRGRTVQGKRWPKLNPVGPQECALFRAVLSGEHAIQGFRNRTLQYKLFPRPADTAAERLRRCGRISRLIAKLRGHGLVAKVPGSRLYRTTPRGHRVMSAALRFRDLDSRMALAA